MGSHEECFKVIQDEYASRYLDVLGIAATSSNKAAILKTDPLLHCEIHTVWADAGASSIAGGLRIVPPVFQQNAGRSNFEDSGKRKKDGGGDVVVKLEKISVQLPTTPGPTKLDPLHGDTGKARGASSRSNLTPGPYRPGAALAEFAAELERVRQRSAKSSLQDAGPFSAREGTRQQAQCGSLLSTGPGLDQELREHQAKELAKLNEIKNKFILPFACEQLAGPNSNQTELRPWSTTGPLTISVPDEMLEEVSKPISIELHEVSQQLAKWVKEELPLDLLAPRALKGSSETTSDTSDLQRVATEAVTALGRPEVARLAGVCAHLLYWLTLGAERQGLSEVALQSLFATAHQIWAQFERDNRLTPEGVSLLLPCLLLALKQGVEHCFVETFPNTFGPMASKRRPHQDLLHCINSLFLRLFDPGGTYARFGRIGCTGAAMALSRKLELLTAAGGHSKSRQLRGVIKGATPLVRAILAPGPDAPPRTGALDPRTRAMLVDCNEPVASLVPPIQRGPVRNCLVRAALSRLVHRPAPGTTESNATSVGRSPRPAEVPAREARARVGPSPNVSQELRAAPVQAPGPGESPGGATGAVPRREPSPTCEWDSRWDAEGCGVIPSSRYDPFAAAGPSASPTEISTKLFLGALKAKLPSRGRQQPHDLAR